MTTTLLAFDSIAPMIGGVVLTGACSFFSGVWLARKTPDDSDGPLSERIVSGLEAEILRLNRERLSDQLADQLTGELFSAETIGNSLAALLRQITPSPQDFAVVLGTGPNPVCPTTAPGLSKRFLDRWQISEELVDRLKTENPLVIQQASDTTGLFQCLAPQDRKRFKQLYLTGFVHGTELLAVLITPTAWPQASVSSRFEEHSLTEIEQRKLMQRTARKMGLRWHQLLTIEQQSHELRSTRDMLELRGIIDSEADEPTETLEQFATRLGEMVQADRVAIYFVARRAGEKLQPIVQCGRPLPPSLESEWHRQEQSLAHFAIESELGNPIDNVGPNQLQVELLIASSVTVPIRVNQRVLGALCLTRQTPNDSLESHRKLIEFGAEMLSQTLRRVFEEATIRRQARHDHLTDLVNRRSFDALLEAEMERVQRGESSTCSLILADLDRFKSYNDRFGHQGGDHVLREAARVLSEQVSRLRMGENSIVARYGGEEFAILLPNMGLAGAFRLAEGIRSAVETKKIHVQHTSLNLTISLGVAACPQHATAAGMLIAVADKALYQAKSSGRNRVCQAEPATHE